MNKNSFAKTPPMGWNSYDYYDTTVNEEEIRANARFMAEHLKGSGYDYIVVDIEWYSYETGSQRDRYQYIPFWKVEMDAYSRLLPCPDKFPSSAGGAGFKPLADYIHSLGLKFGIHIMRGIPRQAAHNHTAILGGTHTAAYIADPSSICQWNPDMYGVRPDEADSQAYYDSIFALYADWGVDFIKCDDICRHDVPSAEAETRMLHSAIMKTGREMVLSLSPGPALIDRSWHYREYANMWRITDDMWDKWSDIRNMFDRCEIWEGVRRQGCYPDCDMLPVGSICERFGNGHDTELTKEEQKTMMTLWGIFGSPMMIGAELTLLDEWTLKLLTNPGVCDMVRNSQGGIQIRKNNTEALWYTRTALGEYLALFNLTEEPIEIRQEQVWTGTRGQEIWTGTDILLGASVSQVVPAHGTVCYKIV